MLKFRFSPLALLGIIIILIGLWTASSYNTLVKLEANSENAFAQIETQFQRRVDLIPNVISTVKGVANFEQTTLQDIVAARSAWTGANNANEKIAAANSFDSALSRLLVTVEAYPELKATQAFRDLITELEGTENRIAYARKEFNNAITEYNKAVRVFPRNLIVSLFAFDAKKNLFQAENGAEIVPVVDFGDNQ